MKNENTFYATGRRKTSAARVFLTPGTGQITINKKKTNEYIPVKSWEQLIWQPLELTKTKGKFDAKVTVCGGGVSSQAGAIRHAISRALCLVDQDHRAALKKEGYLTRDSRMVERKKYGLHKARRSTQFSKR